MIEHLLGYGLAGLVFMTFMLPVIASVMSKLAERRERKEVSRKIHDTIDRITAAGKVNAPKGRYVPRRKHGSLTDHSTSPPRHSGRYNHPWA